MLRVYSDPTHAQKYAQEIVNGTGWHNLSAQELFRIVEDAFNAGARKAQQRILEEVSK
jgi:hypothetical protein